MFKKYLHDILFTASITGAIIIMVRVATKIFHSKGGNFALLPFGTAVISAWIAALVIGAALTFVLSRNKPIETSPASSIIGRVAIFAGSGLGGAGVFFLVLTLFVS